MPASREIPKALPNSGSTPPASEGAKFWAGVCAELRNRGVRDVLIVCCDGLNGFPEAIEATWPQSIVQTCTMHLLRAAMRFVSYQDRKRVAAALRPIYTAPTDEAARLELDAFAGSELGRRYSAAVMAWENAWERFIPFLGFPRGFLPCAPRGRGGDPRRPQASSSTCGCPPRTRGWSPGSRRPLRPALPAPRGRGGGPPG
jgi:hypothetical protein